MAFAFVASHGAGPAIASFSIAHHITGSAAWVAALVMMALADVLTRLAVVWLRGRRLAGRAVTVARRMRGPAPVPDLASGPAAGHTVSMRAQPAAAGPADGTTPPTGPDPATAAHDGTSAPGETPSAREQRARSRARERGDRQRAVLRPLGWVFVAVVVTASAQARPAPGLRGAGLGITLTLAAYAAAVATAITVGWARRGTAAQVAITGLIGGCAVALAVWQPAGLAGVAASMGVWIAAVRLAPVPAAAVAGTITAALAVTVGLTARPGLGSAFTAILLCLLLAVTGQFMRRSRESQDRTEMLLAQLEDARDAEAAAAALAERGRIAGELHDVLAHSLSGLTIQLQGARKLAEREPVGAGLRAAIERSAELAKAGLTDARQAVGALRGDRLPTLDQLGALVADFRRDTGADAALRVEGAQRPLPADASLALYRAAQEALTNIARYAPGAETAVTVRYLKDRTLLTVADHARRLAAGTTPDVPGRARLLADAGGGHGLTAMRERAERAGGTARAGQTADGWLVEVEVPG